MSRATRRQRLGEKVGAGGFLEFDLGDSGNVLESVRREYRVDGFEVAVDRGGEPRRASHVAAGLIDLGGLGLAHLDG